MPLLTTWWRVFLMVLWPPHCIGCSRLGTQLCPRCGQHITWWDNTRTGQEDLQLYPGLQAVFSAVEYVDLAAQLVQAVKFSGYWDYCQLMANLIILQCTGALHHHHVDQLIPVPIHPRRRSERGFNQTEKLAFQLSNLMHIPVNTTCLTRPHYRKKQSLQSQQERQSLDHDFSVQGPLLQGKVLCLIDDVFTTGATLSACARALEKLQPKKIIALTFARAR